MGHLLERRPRTAHRHDDPVDAGPVHNLRLAHVLGIVAIDRRQGHDRLDPLAGDELTQGVRLLPGSAEQPARHDHAESLRPRVADATRRPRRTRAARPRPGSRRGAAGTCVRESSTPCGADSSRLRPSWQPQHRPAHASGRRLHVFGEPPRIAQGRAVAEADQLRLQLDQPAGRIGDSRPGPG